MVRDVAADRAKTAAISKYVKLFREDLLREIPEERKADRHRKRLELLRVGRERFLAEPSSVQHQFFSTIRPSSSIASSSMLEPPSAASTSSSSAASHLVPAASAPEQNASALPSAASSQKKRRFVRIPSSTSGDASCPTSGNASCPFLKRRLVRIPSSTSGDVRELELVSPGAAARVRKLELVSPEPAERGVQAVRCAGHQELGSTSSGSAGVRECSGVSGKVSQDEELAALGKSLGKLQNLFGIADGAEVLAAAYRIAPHASGIQATVEVKSAAILSIAMKMTLTRTVVVPNIQKLWLHVAGSGMSKVVKMQELCLFERLALDGLLGPYATERMAMFSDA